MIKDVIETIVGELEPHLEFVYGDLFETNLRLDNIVSTTDWYYVYIPPLQKTDTIGLQREIHTSFPLQAFIVKRLGHMTIDSQSEEVQPTIDEATEIARKFIHKLNHNSIIDKSTPGITSVLIRSEYHWQDVHLYGVSIEAQVPIYEGKTGC